MISSRCVFFPQKRKYEWQKEADYVEIPLSEYLISPSQVETLKTAVEQGICDRGEIIEFNYDICVGIDMLKMLLKHYPEEILKLSGFDMEFLKKINSCVVFPDGNIYAKPIILMNLNYLVKDPAYMLDSAVVETVVKQLMIVKYAREYAAYIDKKYIGGDNLFSSGFLFWCYFKASFMGKITRLSIMKEYGMYSLGTGICYDTLQVKLNLIHSRLRSKREFLLYIAEYFGSVCAWSEICKAIQLDERTFLTKELGFTPHMIGTYYSLCGGRISTMGMKRFENVDLSDIDNFIYGEIDTDGILRLCKEEK